MEVPRRNEWQEVPPMDCGLFAYRPKHLQRFNCMRSFMGFFTTLLIVYGMASPYMSSVLPSIEKRFGFSSRSMGIIMSVGDVGIMLAALATAHFGGRKHSHRPRYIFIGSALCGLSCIVLASPEMFFPTDAASVVGRMMASANTTEHLCTPHSNASRIVNNATVCEIENEGNAGALIVMCVADFFLGVGSTVLLILGLPFIDDNVHLDDAPIYFAISFFGRIFGPMLGFGLGAVCNNIFLDFSKPRFHQTDPNWVSAWYLGFLVIGVAVFVFAFIIGCFPAHISNGRATLDYYAEASSKQSEADLSSCDVKPSSADGARASWREFAHDMKRLLTNFPFMCRAFSNVLDGMIITGFLAFFFKFIAQQFQLSQALASLAGGVPTIFGIALGVVAGGLLIRRYRLQPKHVCLMLVISAAIMCVVSLVSINLGCERTEVLGLNGSESLHRFYEGYNVRFNDTYCSSSMNCGCSELEFRPVYDPKSGVNFYSPCHAGCSKYQVREWHDEEVQKTSALKFVHAQVIANAVSVVSVLRQLLLHKELCLVLR
ncbi:hypothetical protein RvY_15585-1 [Ramazzottius varieornatus]|uniref:Solute carrier organic anion transporter family member n=1 Tax=Ramazzottius varieornatus TaxID=947166 RepID=A0A1D1VVF1_RAMVA|nr:hypothetical protein RvY_15585-1 [Ramazzottius varieornatus]